MSARIAMSARAEGRLPLRLLRGSAARGHLQVGGRLLACTVGRTGVRALKREGDGATPLGAWRPVAVLYRADRALRPRTRLPVRRIRPDDGWCDAAGDRNYNRRVRHPYPASAELLWRDDRLYDLVVVLDHNTRPRMQGLGSAVFVHLARPDRGPTAGCIAFAARDLRWLLAAVGPESRLDVLTTPRPRRK